MLAGTLNYNIDIQAQSVVPLNKRYKPRLDFLKTGHFQEIIMYSSTVYARSRFQREFSVRIFEYIR